MIVVLSLMKCDGSGLRISFLGWRDVLLVKEILLEKKMKLF